MCNFIIFLFKKPWIRVSEVKYYVGANELGNRQEGQGYHLWVVTLALEPVTQRNHLLEGGVDGPRPLKFEFMAPKI